MNDIENINVIEELKKNDNSLLLTAQDIAKKIRISKSLAYRLMQSGEIKTVKFGRSVRVRPSDLEAFILNSLVENN